MAHFTENLSMGFSLLSRPVTSTPISIKQPAAHRGSTITGMLYSLICYLASYEADKVNKSHFLCESMVPALLVKLIQ